MTRNHEAFFGMTLKVKNFGIKNATPIALITAAPPLFTTLSTLITNLIAADAGSRADITGFAIDKNNKRNILEALCLKVSNALAAYGAVSNDTVLLKRADFATSFWDKCTEEALITEATIVSNLASPTATTTALAAYGIVAADVTGLATALSNFVNVVSDPSLAIDVRAEDNERIVTTLDAMRTHFDTKLDVVMRVFESNNPALYNLYQSAREIDNNGSSKNPTVETIVEALSTVSIHKTQAYNPNRFFTFQNLSNDEAVMVSLSTSPTVEGPSPILLPAGETRQRVASNLANDGIHIIIHNPSNSSVSLKLWVEE